MTTVEYVKCLTLAAGIVFVLGALWPVFDMATDIAVHNQTFATTNPIPSREVRIAGSVKR